MGVSVGLRSLLGTQVESGLLRLLSPQVNLYTFGGIFEAMFGVSLGIILGVSQWIVLRNKVEGSGWWILVNTVSVTLAVGLSEITDIALSEFNLVTHLIILGVVWGSIQGIVTGATLRWGFRIKNKERNYSASSADGPLAWQRF